MRIENRQLSFATVLAASFAGACLVLFPTPAHAGWGKNFARTVLPSLVRRAAVSMIQRELYDLESDRVPAPNFAPDRAPDPRLYDAPDRAPGPRLYDAPNRTPDPAQARSVRATRNPKSTVQQPSGYHWTPRSAMDYLQNDDDRSFDPTTFHRNVYPPLNPVPSSAVAQSFRRGLAGSCSYDQLVNANVFVSAPLHGSVFKRHGRVKYIILHSTETGSPADARRVIQSWNNKGLRHPGAQFVVDRDGTICSTVNPDQATVHIDTSKTLAGYSNDNSVGIEIVRSGKQQYTRAQLDSVTCLVSYLQSHYDVPDTGVTTHHHVQPSDRSDPVNFDLVAFENDKSALQATARADCAVSQPQIADAKHAQQLMPKPAPDFRLRN